MGWSSNSVLTPVIVLAACVTALAQGPTYQLGRTPSEEEIRAWGIIVGPAGKELPPGSGTAKEGATVFAQQCKVCHGATGAGRQGMEGPGPAVVGSLGTITNAVPMRTPWSWPYATTIWDYINRAMPLTKPGSLSADEVYALTAFLLYQNKIIQETDVIDAKSLPKVQMPFRDNFEPANPGWKPGMKRPFGYYP